MQKIEKDEQLSPFYQNDDGHSIIFVEKGLLRGSYINEQGKEFVIDFFKEGDSFLDLSLSSLFSFSSICYRLVALESTIISYSNRSENTKLYYQLLEKFYKQKMKREAQFLLKSSQERLQDFESDFPQLSKRLPQYLIASYLGIAPQSLCRLLRK